MKTQSPSFRLAAPGYVPQKSWWKDLALRLVGSPNLIKRLQMPDIFAALALRDDEVSLDFGCGNGYMTFEMARRCRKAYGLDVINVAENVIPAGLRGRIEFRRARGEQTPFEDDTFDAILMSEVVPMIDEPRLFFDEVTRILKPGGRIVLVNPLERRAIRRDYAVQAPLVRLMQKLGRAPRDYDDYTSRLQESFGTALRHLPDERFYRELLRAVGFEVVETVFTPAAAAQEFYERLQYIALCCRRATFGPQYFVLYPLVKLLNYLGGKRRGTGCVMVARPATTTAPAEPASVPEHALSV